MTSQLDKTTLAKRFSELTEGNWRNSFYIDCSSCPYERPEACGDFLFVPDETGRPFLYPAAFATEQFGIIDWSDCLGRMSNFMFRELYHRWLNTRTLEKTCCPIRKMVLVSPGGADRATLTNKYHFVLNLCKNQSQTYIFPGPLSVKY